ncbi:hypothetical protein OAN70_01380 [Candidatus Pelagibacter sp.]|nr:hypothetical protein [Candidatus Pelagibacter sp.]|tara:strand:+ start:108 stop:962 length:855 start_codon:yes stop_codon:yes gene_type:complete
MIDNLLSTDLDRNRADNSIHLYKELLKHTDKLKNEFLKNAKTFENQLDFGKINHECYHKLYSEIKNTQSIKPINHFYNEIEGLEEINKKAYKFYISPRNKSIKGLDVQLGNKFDEVVINFLNAQGIKAGRADVKNKKLPDIQILDSSKNIKAYIEHKYHNAPFMLSHKLIGREAYEGSITMDSKKLKKQIIECESELGDRPVYIVHWVDFPHLKGIFFNTLSQIKDYLDKNDNDFERKSREGDYKIVNKINLKKGYLEKFYPPLHEMGDFDELIRLLSPNVKKT